MKRRKLTDSDIKQIGTECANCGSKELLQYHHIVPIYLGGKDINTNMVCLCAKCHDIIHDSKCLVSISMGGKESTRLAETGIKRNYRNKSYLRERHYQKDYIKTHYSIFYGDMTGTEIQKYLNIGSNYFSQLVRELKSEGVEYKDNYKNNGRTNNKIDKKENVKKYLKEHCSVFGGEESAKKCKENLNPISFSTIYCYIKELIAEGNTPVQNYEI